MRNYQQSEMTVSELGALVLYWGSIGLVVAGVYGLLFGFQ